MAIKEILVDTDTLKQDQRTMEETLGQMEGELSSIYGNIRELDAMWEGQAKDAFRRQFTMDEVRIHEICNELRQYIKSLGKAQAEYVKCESYVSDVVSAIRI